MIDRSELALQLTDAVSAAYTVIQRAGDRAFRAFGLSHRAQPSSPIGQSHHHITFR